MFEQNNYINKDEFKTEDILELSDLSEERVIKYMEQRYLERKFYTWAGQTLVAVHPFEDNSGCENADSRKPSVNAIISRVWFKLMNEIGNENQAIVISGDSGSGKTFSACLAIKHIAEKQSYAEENPSCSILWQTWCSVPLLTAFGNAATGCNNNSSRFGKLMQLQYQNNQIVGAFIQTYMLEKSRVSIQNKGEGNFHIFHQMLESLDDETLKLLHLNKNAEYKIVPKLANYLKSTYEDTLEAMEILKIKELNEILTVLAVILNLGNVEFEPCFDYYTVSTDTTIFVERAASLLKTQSGQLVHLLTNRFISATSQGKRRVTCYSSPCNNPEECSERRNCLMRFLYDKLFNWLVKRINHNICKNGSFKLLGILDIYGFEVYDHNTFEQLCINYANERLQQLFIKGYLMKKQEELKINFILENVQNINENEYQERISLLDGPISIFSILNEVPEEMSDFIFSCRLDFLENILDNKPYVQTQKDCGKTLLQKFKKSVDLLTDTLSRASLHFIKCIKPNLVQEPKVFNEEVFLNQIRANGITEILKLHFQKYTIIFEIKDFQQRFSKTLIELLKESLNNEIAIGKSRIYLTQKGFEIFQTIWNIRKKMSARTITTRWKRKMKLRNRAATTIQKFFQKIRANKLSFPATSKNRFAISSSISEDSTLTSGSSLLCHLTPRLPSLSPTTKVREYFNRINYPVMEGDLFSLSIEHIASNLKTKSFTRCHFHGDRVVSKTRLTREHTESCLPIRLKLSKMEQPKGLPDIL